MFRYQNDPMELQKLKENRIQSINSTPSLKRKKVEIRDYITHNLSQ